MRLPANDANNRKWLNVTQTILSAPSAPVSRRMLAGRIACLTVLVSRQLA
jgi:hypothetical protein